MLSNPILSAIHNPPLKSNIPASVACVLFTVVGVSLAVLFGDFAPKTAAPPPAAPPPAPAQVETRISTEGQDSSGRSLPFTVYVLAAQLSWPLPASRRPA